MPCSISRKEPEDSNIYYLSYGTKVGTASEMSSSTQSEELHSQIPLLPTMVAIGFLLVVTGSVMMLISMAMDWYTVHQQEYSYLDFALLNKSYSMNYYGLNWSGAVLPLILIFIFASFTILFAVVSLFTGQLYKRLWGLLGLLSAAALIANSLYMHIDGMSYRLFSGNNVTYDVTPHAGWVVALIGIIAICAGVIAIGISSRKKSYPQIALLPGAIAQIPLLPRRIARGFLIMITGAVMMLLTMVLDLYTVHGHHPPFSLDFDLLNNSDFWINSTVAWPGTALLLIPIIIFATIAILSIVYSLATGQSFKKLWIWLSLFSAVALIANFVYLRVVYYQEVIPDVGWVLSFIGTVAISIGAITIGNGSKKRLYLS